MRGVNGSFVCWTCDEPPNITTEGVRVKRGRDYCFPRVVDDAGPDPFLRQPTSHWTVRLQERRKGSPPCVSFVLTPLRDKIRKETPTTPRATRPPTQGKVGSSPTCSGPFTVVFLHRGDLCLWGTRVQGVVSTLRVSP